MTPLCERGLSGKAQHCHRCRAHLHTLVVEASLSFTSPAAGQPAAICWHSSHRLCLCSECFWSLTDARALLPSLQSAHCAACICNWLADSELP